ncbi:MAG: hypothetical protein DDT39_01065 [Firmicutes bacterium]|nr:hypothetical protein [candidate division NPL-UPA2 bacterium]
MPAQQFFIQKIDRGHLVGVIISTSPCELLGILQVVLGAADQCQHGLRRIPLGVDVLLLETGLDQGKLVLCVVDDKVPVKSYGITMLLQDTHSCGMKRRYPEVSCLRQQPKQTLAHLVCRLIRKGYSENVPWTYADIVDEVSNALRQHPRLTATGPG